MNKLLRTVVTTYVVLKVAPPIIKGVAYIAEGAATGIADKIVKDIFKILDDDNEKKPRRNLERSRKYYKSYCNYNLRNKEEA